MAVLSRPSLRSSLRKHTSLEEVPPTDIQQNPLPNTRRGKRPRGHNSDSDSNTSVKKQKPSPPQKFHRSKDRSISRGLKSLPLRDKPATQDAVTSRPKVFVQHKPNGFSTTTTNVSAAAHNAQAILKNNQLTIDTTSTVDKADKRSLRSHDGGSRCKSELALYFPNYDELVSIEPKEPEFLTPETVLYITEDPPNTTTAYSPPFPNHNDASKFRKPNNSHSGAINGSFHTLGLSESTFTNLNDATMIDLSSIDESSRPQKDTMTDGFYLKAHRRAERQEKQLRNIEKERAMHEKVQLERVMEGLRGHDWLRVMGISGITDGEKKAFEPKRDYFIREVRVLLKKFQEWKEEEKRRKVEKEESMQDEDEDQDEDDDEEDGDESENAQSESPDDDASAERQLHREAISSHKSSFTGQARSHHKKNPDSSATPKPFTSFFSKSYMREAAISQHRRGRARYAFGHPLPEPLDRPFELGSDILTPDVLAAQERKRRASNRHTT